MHVEEALLGKNKAEDRDNLSPAWNNPVTTATTGALSNEESLIHDLKKQGHSIKAKLEEIDKKILDLNPRFVRLQILAFLSLFDYFVNHGLGPF